MNIRWCILFTSLQFTERSLFSLLLLVFCKRLHVADELKCCVCFFLFCFQFIIPVQRQIHHKQIYNLCVKNNNNNQCFDEMNSKKKTKHCATFAAIRLNPSHLCMRLKGSYNCVLQNYVNLQRINYNFFLISPYFKRFFPQLGNFSA